MDNSLEGPCAKIRKLSEEEDFNMEALDRLSELPDAILCHILSSLPTKSAAQTGTLSKRWKDLWVSVPVLDFDMYLRTNFKGDKSTFDSFAKARIESFTNFLNRLLVVRGDLGTRKFRLACDPVYPECFYTWMCGVRHVEEVDLELWWGKCELPWNHFAGESLKVMKLSGGVWLNNPTHVSFTSLKILNLVSVIYVDDNSIRELLSSCPLLEDLRIDRTEWDNVQNFAISVSSLKRLTLNFQFDGMELYNEDRDEYVKCKLFVDTPNVEYLRILDYISDCIEVNYMPYVAESHFSVNKMLEIDDRTLEQIRGYGSNVSELFRSIPNVKYLTIGSFTMESLSEAFDRRLPVFHKLVHLGVDLDGVNGAILLLTLLEVSPKLESLLLPQGVQPRGESNGQLSLEASQKCA